MSKLIKDMSVSVRARLLSISQKEVLIQYYYYIYRNIVRNLY